MLVKYLHLKWKYKVTRFSLPNWIFQQWSSFVLTSPGLSDPRRPWPDRCKAPLYFLFEVLITIFPAAAAAAALHLSSSITPLKRDSLSEFLIKLSGTLFLQEFILANRAIIWGLHRYSRRWVWTLCDFWVQQIFHCAEFTSFLYQLLSQFDTQVYPYHTQQQVRSVE